jgi:hypothetical protein
VTSIESTNQVIDVLERLRIPYMVVGSLSTMIYGIGRSTKDADIVVQLEGISIRKITAELSSDFVLDPQIKFESATGTTRFVVDVPGVQFSIEFFRLSADPHDVERFRRRGSVHSAQLGRTVVVPTVEDVLITKLRWSVATERSKDADDIVNVIAVQGDDALDWNYIHHWCDQHATRQRLDEIRASIPPIDD